MNMTRETLNLTAATYTDGPVPDSLSIEADVYVRADLPGDDGRYTIGHPLFDAAGDTVGVTTRYGYWAV